MNGTVQATSWWRLRTQAYLVLAVLLCLIVFLGTYSLTEAKRHAAEADELLNSNFRVHSVLRRIEAFHTEALKATAKYKLTSDPAYREMRNRQYATMVGEVEQIQTLVRQDDPILAPVLALKAALHVENALGYKTTANRLLGVTTNLNEIDRQLEQQRSERLDRIRVVAHDLDKVISVAFVIALGVTTWLVVMLYYAVLKPLEAIRRGARRIREGELSYRVERFGGFSELTNLRREFNAMAAKLEELDRQKADFLSTVSHELKTPLTAIKEGLALMIEKQGQLSPTIQARSLEVSMQASKRLETMIRNLLNHAKMESGFYSFDERPKNFIAVLENAIQGVRPIADRKKMIIDLKVMTSFARASFSTEGITHVIENLILNALKYGDNSHPVSIEVRMLEIKPVPQLEVRVTNHGKGLLPAELTQIFERFFRASNSDGQAGVGLGLSVVKRIIEAHHGTVSAESANGVTTFAFRIPQRYESHSTLQEVQA